MTSLYTPFDHLTWKWSQVHNWIIHQPCLQKYDQILYNTLKANCIDGSCLLRLTVYDWRNLGITDLTHIKYLMDAIQKLFKQSSNTNNNETMMIKMLYNKKINLEKEKQELLQENKTLKSSINQYGDAVQQLSNQLIQFQQQIQYKDIIIRSMDDKLNNLQREYDNKCTSMSLMIQTASNHDMQRAQDIILYKKQINDLRKVIESLTLQLQREHAINANTNK